MSRRQRGMLLLPVAIVLAITGALAYTMTREGAVSVAEVDRQYDLAAARYLAEAGLRLAKWQNEKIGCSSEKRFADVALPGMKGTVTAKFVDAGGGELDIEVAATAPLGALRTAVRSKLPMFNRVVLKTVAVASSNAEDTFIRNGSGAQGNATYLQATDGMAHPLLEFSLAALPSRARIMRAELSVYQYYSASVQSTRTLSVHAVTRDWMDDDATWIYPWSAPGGDYLPVSEAEAVIGGYGRYTWRIDSLARRWSAGTQANHGVLLKPVGLNDARFYSLDNGSERPRLVLDYYERCDGGLLNLNL